jgi:hypothetical protein
VPYSYRMVEARSYLCQSERAAGLSEFLEGD